MTRSENDRKYAPIPDDSRQMLDRYQKTAPKLVEWAEKAIPEGFTVFTLPATHRRQIRTTNLVARLNRFPPLKPGFLLLHLHMELI